MSILVDPLKCVNITTALYKIAHFAKICARFQSNSVSRVSGVDVNKDVCIMHHLSGIWSELFLNKLNSQD